MLPALHLSILEKPVLNNFFKALLFLFPLGMRLLQRIMHRMWYSTAAAEVIPGWVFIQQRCVLRIFAAGNQWCVFPIF
jgi:hypothetical protein